MKIVDKSCVEFIEVLSSKEPVPGGGGGAAFVGAIGVALGNMVANLTVGKKKYKEFEEEIKEVLIEAKKIEKELLSMVDKDAEYFMPLSRAYKLPTETEEQRAYKSQKMEIVLKQACEIPYKSAKTCFKAIKIHEKIVDKSSRLVISDIGVGIQCLRACLLGSKLNVKINTKSMKDREYADKISKEVNSIVEEGIYICDQVFDRVLEIMEE
ncbi:cyclodeaminase/cyclohydrolase family protein [Peptacetobacter sp.]|uniref:cyclodeaminase/cyclohydrolase family protein n=1 Tax=Peptacetobacter sp. TaxID=2991975 RepID=UPI002630B62F|nr:cyclodeaminase/cyclohydrolase family protein [Peptacetobacter sp.]